MKKLLFILIALTAITSTPFIASAITVSWNKVTAGQIYPPFVTDLVGIGTTTPQYQLTVSSSTAPQLSLSIGAGTSQWVLRNASGNFYIATTTSNGTATSSVHALLIDTNGMMFVPNGFVSQASSTVSGLLRAQGLGLGKAPSATIRQEILMDSTYTQGLRMEGDLATRLGLNMFVTGDAQVRFTIRPDGLMGWGSGSATTDTNLYRFGTAILATDNSFYANRYTGFGTTTPSNLIQTTIASSTAPQLSLSAGAGVSQWIFRNQAGVLNISTTTVDGTAISNLPSITILNNGNIGIGSSTPFTKLALGNEGNASSSIVVAEYRPGTTTAATLDCRTSNQTKWRMGTSATTLTLTGLIPGQKCMVVVENPNGVAGALTWAVATGYNLYWVGGTLPTQTTTANKQDVWSFLATQSSTTISVLGAQSANF